MDEEYSKAQQALDSTVENGNEPDHLGHVSKRAAIIDACASNDLARLKELTEHSGGLLSDDLRRRAWPLLLNNDQNHSDGTNAQNWQGLSPHRDEEQVQKDVDRAFVYYPQRESSEEIAKRKKNLFNLIVRVLRNYPMLHYFQGYHDIVQIFLLVFGEDDGFDPVSKISLLRIRDYMLPSLSPATTQLRLIPAIIRSADPDLARHLGATPPWFALSSTLTLYAHEIEQYDEIARVFDFLLAHEPVMALYLFASVILSRRKVLMDIPAEDQDMLLFALSKLPQPLDFEILIQKALVLYQKYPPERLPGRAWSSISRYSVLKTARQNNRNSTEMIEAQKLFEKHAFELRRQELLHRVQVGLWKRRKPLFSITFTVLVGVVSYWLRKSGNDKFIWDTAYQLMSVMKKLV